MTLLAVHPFLVALLRASGPEALLAPLPEPGEWESVVREAAAQGLTPLLYRWLKRAEPDPPPPTGLMERVRAQVYGIAARNLALSIELRGVLRALEENRVPCAPLRGLALAEHLYGDIAARPMGDVDLLVRREQVPAAATVLRTLGFREMEHRAGFAQAFSYTLVFLKDGPSRGIVEPHWTIAYPPFVDRIDMDGVWERCVRGKVLSVETSLLSQEDLLLHLCLHLAHHGAAAPLIWLSDVDRLLRHAHGSFDWQRVLSVARQARLASLVSPMLRRVKALLAAPVPDEVLDQLARGCPGSVQGWLARRLAAASRLESREELALFLTLNGFRPRLRYASGLLFPAPEFMRIRYRVAGRGQLGAAYVRRVCRLSWESVKGVVKLLF